MIIKTVIGIGDSFTFGQELIDGTPSEIRLSVEHMPTQEEIDSKYRQDNCFTGVIAKQFGAKNINLGYPGASLASMRDTMTDYIANSDPKDLPYTLVIVGLTQPWRTTWFCAENSQHVHSTWLMQNSKFYDPKWQTQLRHYVEHQLSDELTLHNLNETLLFFDGISARYKIPLIQFNTFPLSDYNHINVPTHYDVNNSMTELIKDPELMCPGWHPNKEGHKVIADHLLSLFKTYSFPA